MGYLNLYILICPTDINMPYMGRLARLGRQRRGRRSNKSRQYKGKRTARLAKPVRRAIKQIINRQQERKYRNESYQRQLNAVTNSTTNEMFTLIPTLAMSSTVSSSSTRIGQKVTCARMYSDIHVSMNTGITGSKDIIVKLWILASKELKNMDDILAWGTAGNRPLPINFLDDGNGGTKCPLGFMYDLDAPVAEDEWTSVKEYVFRLSKSTGVLINNQSGFAPAAPVAYVGDGGSTFRRFRVYHKAPKTLHYTGDINASYPNNYAPVWCLSYAYADGTNPVVANNDVWVNVTNHLEFYDA